MRGVAAVLRARGPVVAALVTSFRAMPAPWFVAVGSPRAGGMSYLAQAPRGSATRRPARTTRPRELVLPADATAPGRARLFLRAATQEWGIGDDLAQDAAMVITELVANAVDHARSESTLSVGVKRGDPVRRRARRPARPGAPARPDRPDGAPGPWPADGRRADQRVGRDAARRRQDRLGGRGLTGSAASAVQGASGNWALVAGELLPQGPLGELADAGLGHLVDELHGVGQPPLGDERLEVREQLLGR